MARHNRFPLVAQARSYREAPFEHRRTERMKIVWWPIQLPRYRPTFPDGSEFASEDEVCDGREQQRRCLHFAMGIFMIMVGETCLERPWWQYYAAINLEIIGLIFINIFFIRTLIWQFSLYLKAEYYLRTFFPGAIYFSSLIGDYSLIIRARKLE